MRPVHIVTHTHWDREWYLSFEEFRERLVGTLDLVLEILARDERWTHFHLDGQTAMVDDYLEVRPERDPDVRAAVASGRASCGPWATLVDEFLVSGESIIRNLEDGVARADALGGAYDVAYLPDQFGHIGQMPQVLAAAGFDRAVVWRGVPSSIDRSSFRWFAPDGSSVGVLYLPLGYGHGMRIPVEPDAFLERVAREVRRLDPFLAPDEPALVTAGSDHERPNPGLPDAVRHAESKGWSVRLTSLREHIRSLPATERSWTGELRSAARANLLPNTYSARVTQKLERARAEHLLERYAEPLAALVPGEEWPEPEVSEAWYQLHLNGAHDSVCGCSIDSVAAAVDERTARVAALGLRVAGRALERLAATAEASGTIAFNPSPFARDGIRGLGWKVLEGPPADPLPVSLEADGEVVAAVGGSEIRLRFEDQADAGDLYTFCPDGPVLPPRKVEIDGNGVRVAFDSCDVELRAGRRGDEPFVRFVGTISNRGPDHRVRVAVRVDTLVERCRAGSPFEIVERPMIGEGGRSEPGAVAWPARGFVAAGGRGFLSEGVFEYELGRGELFHTLLRCVGTISRGPMPVRKVAAGPDVPTPGAQMIGDVPVAFGVLARDPGDRILDEWERYALRLMTRPAPGGGGGPNEGSLLDLDVPALSSIRRRSGELEVRVWNPFSRSVTGRVAAGGTFALGPRRIETIRPGG